jgi:hypothetical protein
VQPLVAGPSPGATPFRAHDGSRPLHDPALRLRDEAVFLLHAAAEVEHALMVQYLYAAYSLRDHFTSADRPPQLDEWRSTLIQIAREEMAHLLTVQNLLHLIGGPLSLERADLPAHGAIYPFDMRLEPLTKRSLAKYVYAEMPGTLTDVPTLPADIAQIKQLAEEGNGGKPLNHVGWLYARITVLFQKLPPEAFRLDTVPFWAKKEHWRRGPTDLRSRLLIGPDAPATPDAASVRDAAVAVLQEIAKQGEGDGDMEQSHFHLFRKIYDAFHFREEHPDEPFPDWMVPVQVNPNTVALDEALPPEMEAGRITDPRTRMWAQLFDLRYRLLLGYLQHSMLLPDPTPQQPTMRPTLRASVFAEMFRLQDTAKKLANLPQPSGAPFELPYTLELPTRDRDRWLTHVDVTLAAKDLIEKIRTAFPADHDDAFLTQMLAADEAARKVMLAAAQGQMVDDSPQGRMVALIWRKVQDDGAPGFHGGIKLDGSTPLSTLFDTSKPGNANFELLMAALTQSNSVRADPGKPLIVPGKPEQSVFYRILSESLIPFMAGKFTAEDQAIVHDWIASLPTGPATLSFASDIRPLFRQLDITSMINIGGFDLSKYEDVKLRADEILSRLSDGSMPCDGAWPAEQIARFKAWIDGGKLP